MKEGGVETHALHRVDQRLIVRVGKMIRKK